MMSVTFWVLFWWVSRFDVSFSRIGSAYVRRGRYGGSESEKNAQDS